MRKKGGFTYRTSEFGCFFEDFFRDSMGTGSGGEGEGERERGRGRGKG